jgi:hypothetical protein
VEPGAEHEDLTAMMQPRFLSSACLSLALLSGCAGYAPDGLQAGDPMAAAVQRMGPPTGEHARADGGRRLEYARGPLGRHTFMLDFDAQGRFIGSEQVLDETHFAAIQPGISERELRYRIGRPGRIWAVHYHDQTVYSYRYENHMCQVFHVGITPQGVVEDTGFGPDPACERRERGNMIF